MYRFVRMDRFPESRYASGETHTHTVRAKEEERVRNCQAEIRCREFKWTNSEIAKVDEAEEKHLAFCHKNEASLARFVILTVTRLSWGGSGKWAPLDLGFSMDPGEQERGLKLEFRIVWVAISSPVLKYSYTVNLGLPKPSSNSECFNTADPVCKATDDQKNKQRWGSDSWYEVESFVPESHSKETKWTMPRARQNRCSLLQVRRTQLGERRRSEGVWSWSRSYKRSVSSSQSAQYLGTQLATVIGARIMMVKRTISSGGPMGACDSISFPQEFRPAKWNGHCW